MTYAHLRRIHKLQGWIVDLNWFENNIPDMLFKMTLGIFQDLMETDFVKKVLRTGVCYQLFLARLILNLSEHPRTCRTRPTGKNINFNQKLRRQNQTLALTETKSVSKHKTSFLMHLETMSITLINFSWIASRILNFEKCKLEHHKEAE